MDELVVQMRFPHKGRKGWQMRNDIEKAEHLASLVRGIAALSPLATIENLLENGYGEWLEDKGWGTRTIDLLKPIASREQTIPSFLDRLEFLSKSFDKRCPNHLVSDSLTLATTHSCKGREFDKVVVIDAIDGIFPSSRRDPLDYGKDEARNWQEERRLFYVAMTRARDELVLLRPADEDTPFVDEVFPRPFPASDSEVAPTPTPISHRCLRPSSHMRRDTYRVLRRLPPLRNQDDRMAAHRPSKDCGGRIPNRSGTKCRATTWTRGRSWRTADPRFADSYIGA